ncbi:amidohydrolase 3 [Metarhizium guizhouense ARSEF 977]|uniref:Amidohydrolase 3 n=1 Tax=Metarhizium guizhouense (strain ARSEF 977) TaxID=1276136 RepID=A0A0B4GJE1_METGA|nr:amidohydrolase 3 [Metarhizium guizhouense ARSEF 977]
MPRQPQPTGSMYPMPLPRWGFIFSVMAIALAVAVRLQQPVGAEPVTYCYKSVRTHDKERASATCFSVQGGVFSRVWSHEERTPAKSGEPSSQTVINGHVMPGLWDGHGHLMAYGEFLHSVDLFGAKSLSEAKARIKAYIKKNPGVGTKDRWIRGVGWDQDVYGRMPTAADLEHDPDLKGTYMMLDRIDVHCIWVSQSVLDLLPPDIPDIPGGEIIREPGMGVFCDNAMDYVVKLWPKPDAKSKAAAVKTAISKLNEVGLVGMHDASSLPDDISIYRDMANSDDWTLRVYSMYECRQRNTFCPSETAQIERDDSKFTVKSVKLFADGALGSWGSAMISPYADHPWTSGSLLVNASTLTTLTKSWAAAGYQVNIHAIGDLANRNAIDAFVEALKQQCPQATTDADLAACQRTHRFRIEHAQIIHPDDQARMHSLGIIPSIQPTHATSDMKYALDRLGPERTDNEAYRMRSLLDINPMLGSDFPVEPPNPFHGIYAAVARKNPGTGLGVNGSHQGWHTDEALSLDQALWGFTGATAYGAFLEGRAGLIKEGAFADWLVLDEPIESLDIEKLRTLQVRETWVAGKKVYARDG